MSADDDPPAPEVTEAQATHHGFLAGAAQAPYRWTPWALLRGAEARAAGLPRIGRSRLPREDAVEIAQDPQPGFAPAAVARIEPARAGGRWRVVGHWFGLLGSMGPLPLHLSEYAHWEARYAPARPFAGFLDVLARRMQQLFFRAWADGHPAAQADRPADDRFAAYVAQLTGAAEGARADEPFPAQARLAYAALFASRRSAVAIEDAMTHLLERPVQLLEYQPRHRELEPEDRTWLGRRFATVGRDAMLGHRVRTVTDAFRIVVGAADAGEYRRLLPGTPLNRLAGAALDAFGPAHLEWDITLAISGDQAPATQLDGRAQLGWTSWVGRGATMRRDAHLRRSRSKGETPTA